MKRLLLAAIAAWMVATGLGCAACPTCDMSCCPADGRGGRTGIFGGGGGGGGYGGYAGGGGMGGMWARWEANKAAKYAGPPTPHVGYPYYTVRGPRDFLASNPPSIGP